VGSVLLQAPPDAGRAAAAVTERAATPSTDDEAFRRDAVAGSLVGAATRGSPVCCYNWCEEIRVTTTTRRSCVPPRTEQIACTPTPDMGTSVPAAAPFAACPIGIVVSEVGPAATRGTFPGTFDAALSTPASDGDVGSCCYDVCAPNVRWRGRR